MIFQAHQPIPHRRVIWDIITISQLVFHIFLTMTHQMHRTQNDREYPKAGHSQITILLRQTAITIIISRTIRTIIIWVSISYNIARHRHQQHCSTTIIRRLYSRPTLKTFIIDITSQTVSSKWVNNTIQIALAIEKMRSKMGKASHTHTRTHKPKNSKKWC